VAEYAGLVLAPSARRADHAEEIDLRLDSKLIVEQLNGRWRVKDAKLQGLYAEARRHLASRALGPRPTNRERGIGRRCPRQPRLDDPDAAALLVAEVARRNGREPPPVSEVDRSAGWALGMVDRGTGYSSQSDAGVFDSLCNMASSSSPSRSAPPRRRTIDTSPPGTAMNR
jgi:hypothetical protein